MSTMDNLQKQRQKLENLVNSQIDPTSGLAINCHNCIHCEHGSTSYFDKCKKVGGNFCNLVTKFSSLYGNICRNHSAWAPRNKSILELLTDKIRSILS